MVPPQGFINLISTIEVGSKMINNLFGFEEEDEECCDECDCEDCEDE